MVLIVDDLIPSVSGASHIGIDGGATAGSFVHPPSPIGNIHILSGVFHSMGQSGIIRFDHANANFQFSVNGGISFQDLHEDDTLGLQDAYSNGSFVLVQEKFGDLTFIANSRKWRAANVSTRAPIRISGLIPLPSTRLEVGDLSMLEHSVTSGTPLGSNRQTQAILRASALGLGTLALNTGSGIANILMGSGIGQFGDSLTTNLADTVSGSRLLFRTIDFADKNYVIPPLAGVGEPRDGIKVMSPGFYKVTYHVTVEKTGGTDRQYSEVTAYRNIFEEILHSKSYAYHRSSASVNVNSHQRSFFIDLNAGDRINLNVAARSTAIPGIDILALVNAETHITFEKLGPRRYPYPQVGQ